MSFFHLMLARKMPQYLASYFGIGWVLMQFTQFMVEIFLWSPHWTKVVVFALLFLLPSYAMVVFRRTESGLPTWDIKERIGVPGNVVVAVVTMFLIFRGDDLGAATTTVTVQDESGNVISREVPKLEFRKRVAMFDFDPVGLPEDVAWTKSFIPGLVAFDLMPEEFFDPVDSSTFVEQIRKAGFTDRHGLPLALKRQIADDVRAEWLFSGEVAMEGDEFVVTTLLHDASAGTLLQEREHRGSDFFALADAISEALVGDLDIPARNTVQNFPVEEYLTSNREAVAAFAKASELLAVNNWAGALELLQQAVQLDPTFTLAQRSLAIALLYSNRGAEALAPIQAALQNAFRLPERLQFIIKSDYFFITQDIDKAFAVIDMWATLFPEDLLALQNLFTVQNIRNQRPEAIATLERIYALNAGRADTLKQIAQLHVSLGNFAEARSALDEYIALYPDDETGYAALANLDYRQGNIEAARTAMDKALLLKPGTENMLAWRGMLENGQGNFAEAEEFLDQALSAAKTAAERMDALAARATYYQVRGQANAAIDTLNQRLAAAAEVTPPLGVLMMRLAEFTLYTDSGREAEARAMLDSLQTQLQPPVNMVLGAGYLRLAIEAGDIPQARQLLTQTEAFIAQTRLENMRPATVQGRAQLAELEQDWEAALGYYRELQAMNQGNNLIHTDIARCLRMLGRIDEARDVIDIGLSAVPANGGAQVERSHILEAQGDLPGAIAALETALVTWADADPGFKRAAAARERLAALTAQN